MNEILINNNEFNNKFKKDSKRRIINISKNNHISPIAKKINEYKYKYKHPQNIFNSNNRFYLKNMSYYNHEDNTFKSNGLGFSCESKNNNDINLKISSDDLRTNNNYNKVGKMINSFVNLNDNDIFNENDFNYINNYNYGPFSKFKKRTSVMF